MTRLFAYLRRLFTRWNVYHDYDYEDWNKP
jgi:hypothetical protein